MSTEATGDGKPSAAGATGPETLPEGAEPTATAVDEPAPTAAAVDEPTANAADEATPAAVDEPTGTAADQPAAEVPRQATGPDDTPAPEEAGPGGRSGFIPSLLHRAGRKPGRARATAPLPDMIPEAETGAAGEAEVAGEPPATGGTGIGEEAGVDEEAVAPDELRATQETRTAEETGAATETGAVEDLKDVEGLGDVDLGVDGSVEAEEPGRGADAGEAGGAVVGREGDGDLEGDEAEGPEAGYEAYVEYEEYAEYAEYEPAEAEGEEGFEPEEAAEPLQRVRRWPRVLLALGFVVLAAAIVGGAVAIVGSVTHGFKKPVKITYKSSPVFSLKTGNCFDPQGQQSYTLVSCDAPHLAEVFATFALTGTTWPGNAAVQVKASDGCSSRLTSYVNPQLAISLSSTYVYPDSVAWQAGTRTVICEVRATSGNLTGSVRGAAASAG